MSDRTSGATSFSSAQPIKVGQQEQFKQFDVTKPQMQMKSQLQAPNPQLNPNSATLKSNNKFIYHGCNEGSISSHQGVVRNSSLGNQSGKGNSFVPWNSADWLGTDNFLDYSHQQQSEANTLNIEDRSKKMTVRRCHEKGESNVFKNQSKEGISNICRSSQIITNKKIATSKSSDNMRISQYYKEKLCHSNCDQNNPKNDVTSNCNNFDYEPERFHEGTQDIDLLSKDGSLVNTKIPFTGSVLTRDPPFHYATICRGSLTSKKGQGSYLSDELDPKNRNFKLQKGSSSHELLLATHNNQGLGESSNTDTPVPILKGSKRYNSAHPVRYRSQERLQSHNSISQCLKSDCSGDISANVNCNDDSKSVSGRHHLSESEQSSGQQFSTLESVVDLPNVTSGSHKYYTLKISNTRHNNESFV